MFITRLFLKLRLVVSCVPAITEKTFHCLKSPSHTSSSASSSVNKSLAKPLILSFKLNLVTWSKKHCGKPTRNPGGAILSALLNTHTHTHTQYKTTTPSYCLDYDVSSQVLSQPDHFNMYAVLIKNELDDCFAFCMTGKEKNVASYS